MAISSVRCIPKRHLGSSESLAVGSFFLSFLLLMMFDSDLCIHPMIRLSLSSFSAGCRQSAGSDTYIVQHATLYFTPNLIHIKQLNIATLMMMSITIDKSRQQLS